MKNSRQRRIRDDRRARKEQRDESEGRKVPIAIRIPVYQEPMHLRCITLRVTFVETRKKRRKEDNLNNFVTSSYFLYSCMCKT